MKRNKRDIWFMGCIILLIILPTMVHGAEIPSLSINIGGTEGSNELSGSLQIMFTLTILALAPSILMMMTSFTRIIISLHFLKTALGTQQMPPNQIIVGLALFMTFFIMSPVAKDINEQAIIPYQNKEITQEVALERMMEPVKEFMLKQTRDEDLQLFIGLSELEFESTESMLEEVPMTVLIPAFIISEIRAGFLIGFLLFLPFIVIDMVVASTLMSMGMMMLPPAMIALPFKILVFVLMDGWNLIVGQLISTFK